MPFHRYLSSPTATSPVLSSPLASLLVSDLHAQNWQRRDGVSIFYSSINNVTIYPLIPLPTPSTQATATTTTLSLPSTPMMANSGGLEIRRFFIFLPIHLINHFGQNFLTLYSTLTETGASSWLDMGNRSGDIFLLPRWTYAIKQLIKGQIDLNTILYSYLVITLANQPLTKLY